MGETISLLFECLLAKEEILQNQKFWVMVNHLYLFVELIIISTNKLVTLSDKKKKKIHVSFEGLVCFASDLFTLRQIWKVRMDQSLYFVGG